MKKEKTIHQLWMEDKVSTRLYNIIKHQDMDVMTPTEIQLFSDEELLSFRNFGPTTLQELKDIGARLAISIETPEEKFERIKRGRMNAVVRSYERMMGEEMDFLLELDKVKSIDELRELTEKRRREIIDQRSYASFCKYSWREQWYGLKTEEK